jgi:hypothetical protein
MKYYIGKILERNGEFEYTDMYLFKTEGDPHKFTEKTAMEWRGGDEDGWDEAQDGYWSDHTLIFNAGHNEIPEEDFIVLNKYLPAMVCEEKAVPRELTADEKAFAKAVEWNGGYENEAVLAFILSNGDDSFNEGKWGEYYSSLTDLSNVFWDALKYARGQK